MEQKHTSSHRPAERGQAIVLMAFLIIGLLAITGLAVDGGGLLYLQRDTRNAVDAAVVAATYAKCTNASSAEVVSAAHDAAMANGFENGVSSVTVNVNNPPSSGPGAGNSEFVEVIIEAEKPSYFIQLVYDAPLRISIKGTGRCKPSTTNTSGRALFAACTGSETGIEVQASSSCSGEIVGGIHSNSAAKSNNGMCVQGDVSTSDSASQLKGTANGNPLPGEADENVDVRAMPFTWNLADFDTASDKYPSRIISQFGSDNYGTLPGGLAIGLDDIPTEFTSRGLADPTTEPVLVYVNGDINIKPGSPPAGTIYYITIVATGQIKINGNVAGGALVIAGEYPVGTNWFNSGTENGMDNLLFFSSRDDRDGNCKTSGNTAIDFSVNSAYWRGIAYAPVGDVTISGSSSETSYGAIWAQAIKYAVSGMTLEFDSSILPPDPPFIGLAD